MTGRKTNKRLLMKHGGQNKRGKRASLFHGGGGLHQCDLHPLYASFLAGHLDVWAGTVCGSALLKKNTGRLAAALLFVHVAGRFICALLSVDRLFGIPVYIWFRNWLFMGLPFFLLGDWFRQNQETLVQKFSTKTLLAAFSLGVVLTVAETVLVAARTGDDRELYLGIFLMIFALFLLAWKKPRQDHEGVLARIGRNYLLEIYLLHLWVMEALDLLLSKTGLHIPGIGWTKPFLVLLVSAALGVVWKKRRNVS